MSVRRAWLVAIGAAFVALATVFTFRPDSFADAQYGPALAVLPPAGWALVHAVVGILAIHVGYVGWTLEPLQRLAHAAVTAVLVVWAAGYWVALYRADAWNAPTAPIYLTVLAVLAMLLARSDLDSHREHGRNGQDPRGSA
ncbi:hypothetical protein [Aquisalimonas sp.]|uniref:hypothetical protein n=1 Tax=Aquisalimonas sp. TaxID=1872621 RepID=UPI0025B81532|nr:hypothetical protein [Aquisalimonas sp.]